MITTNDILVSKFGYDCTLVNFYKVVKATGKTVMLQKIGEKIVDDDGYGQAGHVVPNVEETIGNPFRRKCENSEYVKVGQHSYARKWDGEKVAFDSYD